jgi:hypothetical protein
MQLNKINYFYYDYFLTWLSIIKTNKNTNSVAFSMQTDYTDQAAACCLRI